MENHRFNHHLPPAEQSQERTPTPTSPGLWQISSTAPPEETSTVKRQGSKQRRLFPHHLAWGITQGWLLSKWPDEQNSEPHTPRTKSNTPTSPEDNSPTLSTKHHHAATSLGLSLKIPSRENLHHH